MLPLEGVGWRVHLYSTVFAIFSASVILQNLNVRKLFENSCLVVVGKEYTRLTKQWTHHTHKRGFPWSYLQKEHLLFPCHWVPYLHTLSQLWHCGSFRKKIATGTPGGAFWGNPVLQWLSYPVRKRHWNTSAPSAVTWHRRHVGKEAYFWEAFLCLAPLVIRPKSVNMPW